MICIQEVVGSIPIGSTSPDRLHQPRSAPPAKTTGPTRNGCSIDEPERGSAVKEEIPVNSFKRAIASGRLQIGLWCSLSSHLSVEVVAGSGFDWLLLDTEHSPN
ncbi:MAG: hypothetical protein KDG54_20775, partial [Geminicoccaceae bacterium]|nr:hypothetical protein [Geminicoccaceae bacterium]